MAKRRKECMFGYVREIKDMHEHEVRRSQTTRCRTGPDIL